MIDLHYAPTPNGWKISMLEELELPIRDPGQHPRRRAVRAGIPRDQPNNRIPAIVDHAPADAARRFRYSRPRHPDLSRREDGRFLPTDMRGRSHVVQWVMWQMSGLGPMLGQHGHFALYAAEKILTRSSVYRDEAARLYCVLDTQLGKTGAYIAGDYSIADIACFPGT